MAAWSALCSFISLGLLSNADEVFQGPSNPGDWQNWIDGISSERTKDLSSVRYNGSIFDVVPLQWTQSSFIQPQMHGYDAYFYDVTTHAYTYDKWAEDLVTRYGGIDSFLFWVTYTNIGADDRNQFDMNYAIPGGMQALQDMVTHMHDKYDIKVLFPYNPWDTGTHYSGNPDYITMAQFLNETGGDGFNGDTMGSIPENFYTYSYDTYGHAIALEAEGGGSLDSMNWDTMGWGYWSGDYGFKPVVGKWHWYDGRHMTNVCDRWAKNRTSDVQNAFFNGQGYESWENVWGCWNGVTPRDGEAIRRVSTMLRYFGNRNHNKQQLNFTEDVGWLPYIPVIAQSQYQGEVFASAFIPKANTKDQQITFLIVNRGGNDITDLEVTFDNSFTVAVDALTAYDCYHGIALDITASTGDKTLTVKIAIEGSGYGAILVGPDTRSGNSALDTLLTTMATMTAKPLSSYSAEWKFLLQTMTPIPATKAYSAPPDSNSVAIPRGLFYYENTGVEIEGGDDTGVDVQFPFEMSPRKDHAQYMTIPKLYMDQYPVTCSDYKAYLTSSGYKPTDAYNYLKNWNYSKSTDEYMYQAGYAKKPVTYLGISEARAYCKAVGKRLPHSYEWQYAAQGNTSYLYPWGNKQEMGSNFPNSHSGRSLPGPENVDAYTPKGNSMFGVGDLIGNVWQYTDEFTDPHTRAVVVHGSANYRPSGSQWYFPIAYQLNQHNKYFLMDDTYERAGTIGFRCAADAVQPTDGGNPFNWNGQGNYCSDGTPGNEANNVGPLCGMINPQDGYNNLTERGNLDWVQFGMGPKTGLHQIRKNTNTQWITSLAVSNGFSEYTGNPNGFYWNDGDNTQPILPMDQASTDGIYIAGDGNNFQWQISGLKGGNVYRLRVYVGVYQDYGTFSAELQAGTTKYTFSDASVYNGGTTSNVVYDLILNLKSVSSSEELKLFLEWLFNGGKGNITLQAIALALIG